MQVNQTKQKIFDVSVELFSKSGYDEVTIRTIAAKAGIAEGTIYRHFKSKADILENIFCEFSKKIKKYLLTKEQVDAYIDIYTPRQLLECCVGQYSEEEVHFMSWAYRIISREYFVNHRAMELINDQLYTETVQRIHYVLDQLAARKKIPEMDTKAFAIIWARVMFSTAEQRAVCHYDDARLQKVIEEHRQAVNWLIDLALSGRAPV